MVFGKLSEAVSDLSETLRRVFQPPPTHGISPSLNEPPSGTVSTLEAVAITPPYSPAATPAGIELLFVPQAIHLPTRFEGRLISEASFANWAAGAVVCQMQVFSKGAGRQVGIPPLPKRATCYRQDIAGFTVFTQRSQEIFSSPAVRGGSPQLGSAVVLSGLEMALGMPIGFTGQNMQLLPKAIAMRYNLQLVKATGENIRNLDVLGLFHIPSKGVAGMRHDPKTGKLFLQLTSDAAKASRLPFLLAQRKDDRSLVSCFLEEG
ncbi:MAG: hypothetical protein Q8O00_14765 [Holophaga sp.]|nr:hypothetical protein [Holophaga sp.]